MKKQVFHIGDIVKIVNPEIFIRVGYPLSLEDVREELDKYDSHITALMNITDMPWYNSGAEYKIREGIKKALGFGILARRNFGGNERKIYTQKYDFFVTEEDIVKEMVVIGKKIVRTGTRDTYKDSEYGGSRAYLDKAKSHVILTLRKLVNELGYKKEFQPTYLIEDKNVEKLRGIKGSECE